MVFLSSLLISYCLFLSATSSFLLLFQLLLHYDFLALIQDTCFCFLVVFRVFLLFFGFGGLFVFLHLPYFYHHVPFFLWRTSHGNWFGSGRLT